MKRPAAFPINAIHILLCSSMILNEIPNAPIPQYKMSPESMLLQQKYIYNTVKLLYTRLKHSTYDVTDTHPHLFKNKDESVTQIAN